LVDKAVRGAWEREQMKIFGNVSVLLSLAGLMIPSNLLHAQMAIVSGLNNNLAPVQTTTPDSIVQITAEENGLDLVPPDQVPGSGTFWVLTQAPGGGTLMPWPCPPPADQNLPVYAIAENIFLVDATAGSPLILSTPLTRRLGASYTQEQVLATQANLVVNLINQVQETDSK
jgi:hypothetical protein